MKHHVTNIMPMENWAFKVVCDNLKVNLPDFEFKDMQLEHGGVKHMVSPNMFKFCKGDKATVLRLDGHRWYENYMVEDDK